MTATAIDPAVGPDWPFLSPDSDELAGLVAGLRANPANELARLVVADWHEENGDPDRAEYIRLASRDTQSLLWDADSPAVALYVGADAPDGWHVAWGPDREGETAPIRRTTLLPALAGVSYTGLRGFVVGWRGPVYQWLDHGRTVMRREPVAEVTLEGVEPRYEAGQRLWMWHRQPEDGSGYERMGELPDVLFDCLPQMDGKTNFIHAAYRSSQAATDDLRRAAARFALG